MTNEEVVAMFDTKPRFDLSLCLKSFFKAILPFLAGALGGLITSVYALAN